MESLGYGGGSSAYNAEQNAKQAYRGPTTAPPPNGGNGRVSVSALQEELDKASTVLQQEVFELEMTLHGVLEQVPSTPAGNQVEKRAEMPTQMVDRQTMTLQKLVFAIEHLRVLRRRVLL
jgi:hypothetical protein